MSDGTITVLRALRLALSGAIAGTALFGLVAPLFGLSPIHSDALGAGVGFASTLAAIKFLHLV